MGIPHSEFLSWDEEDQDKALAWQLVERDRCPGCGTQSWEQDVYVPRTRTCRTCARVENYSAEFHDQHPPKKPGKAVVLVRKETDG